METLSVVLMLIVTCLLGIEVESAFHITHAVDDEIIKTVNYPSPYPPSSNFTWEMVMPTGEWAVVFEDFKLGQGKHDRVIFDDRGTNNTKNFTSSLPPPFGVEHASQTALKSAGPHLVLHFIADDITEPDSKGFMAHIVYGKDKHELSFKLMELQSAAKKKKDGDEDGTSPMLAIIAGVLVFLVVAVFAISFYLVRKRCPENGDSTRDAFGVRRNSGICHNRSPERLGSTSSNVHQPTQPQRHHGHLQQQHQHGQQQQQQPPELLRPVQRSNSQLNWMARAELNTTIQNAQRKSKANLYTTTAATSDMAVKGTRRQLSDDTGAPCLTSPTHTKINFKRACFIALAV